MNKIAHILAAALGAALAVALAVTFSPAPSVAWAFWALLGGGAGYLAQDPRGAAVEAFRATSEMAKIAARRFRHLCRRVRALSPFWVKASLTVFRPRPELLLFVTFLAFLLLVSWSWWVGNISGLVAGLASAASLAILSLIVLDAIGGDVSKTLTKTRWNYTEAEFLRVSRRAYRHSRWVISQMSFGEIAFAILASWASFLLKALRIVAWLTPLAVALFVLAKYPVPAIVIVVSVTAALFWRLLLRGAGKVVLASARRLHTQKRLVAGAGATLGAVSGLMASFVWGVLGVPILAAVLGAAFGALFGWGLTAGSSRVVSRFGFATA